MLTLSFLGIRNSLSSIREILRVLWPSSSLQGIIVPIPRLHFTHVSLSSMLMMVLGAYEMRYRTMSLWPFRAPWCSAVCPVASIDSSEYPWPCNSRSYTHSRDGQLYCYHHKYIYIDQTTTIIIRKGGWEMRTAEATIALFHTTLKNSTRGDTHKHTVGW